MVKSVIVSTGSYLPKKIITNDDLSKTIDTSDEWISTRSGIKQRHISNEIETTAYMASEASKKALENSKGITAQDLDLIIVTTTTPDSTFPSTACKVQNIIGAKNAAAFDLQAVCSGFLYGLSVTESMIKGGSFKNVLLIGADKMSSIIDWKDRSTCVLFGDGAGAVILSSTDPSNVSGVISSKIESDGSLGNILYTSGGTATTKTAGFVKMEGKEVFKHAVQKMTSSMEELLESHNLTHADIDWIVPHQANIRIIELIAKKMELPQDKIIATIDKHANTSAASIPLAIDTEGTSKFKKGDKIIFTAAGGGFTWGSVLLIW